MAIVLLLSRLSILLSLPFASSTLPSTCDPRETDPCLPGGKYDPILKSCNGYQGQECFGCYSGTLCSGFNETCSINLGGGQPVWADEYWEGAGVCTEIGSYYQTPYTFTTAYQPLLDEIIKLHGNVGNAKTDGYEIVLGVGATGVMNSVLYAVAKRGGRTITAQAPHYGNYVQQTQNTYSPSPYPSFLTFESDANISDNNNTYEILTYPNNPDGSKRNPISKNVKNVIYDCIYYWPHFTEIDVQLEHDIMIFSASKHTGHAASRLGWALVKDPEIAELMRDFSEREIGVSIDSQIRYTYTLNFLNDQFDNPPTDQPTFYHFSADLMASRFDAVTKLFTNEVTGEVETINDITFVNSETRGAYVWLSHSDEDVDLEALLEGEALITGTPGTSYGVGTNFARIQMMARSVEIEDFVGRLEAFLALPYDPLLSAKYAAAKLKNREVKKVLGC
ncbi:hypothetical protein TrVE_jg2607 [Triparma verrucosa]|uniref:Alliinase C-terminal domain-containing protein n=1 Tax=Triparma verrucosa TaxID=1606542 RepID=A0A9W7BQR3_9STRA|nr:hypothetical protein TrVE_jg2607 [Triparma verrucosa]